MLRAGQGLVLIVLALLSLGVLMVTSAGLTVAGEQPLTLADLRPVVVDAVVAGDRVEPHGEVRPRIETVQLPVDPDNDLLSQFFRFLVAAGEAIREGEESPAMPANEVGPRGVGVQFAGPQRLDCRDVL